MLLGRLSLADVSAEDARGAVSRVAAARASRALAGLTTLQQVLDAAADGLLPPVLHVTTEAAGTYVEFDVPRGAASALEAAAQSRPRDPEDTVAPVCWFQFLPMGGAVRRFGQPPPPEEEEHEAPQAPRPEKLTIKLRKRRAGNVCVVRMLSAENLVRGRGAPPVDIPQISLSRVRENMPATEFRSTGDSAFTRPFLPAIRRCRTTETTIRTRIST